MIEGFNVPEHVPNTNENTSAIIEKDVVRLRNADYHPTNSVHYGDMDLDGESDTNECDFDDDDTDVSWSEVCLSCCSHSPREWGWIFLGVLTVFFLLYWFMFGLVLLGRGSKVMTGCAAGALFFGDDTNPVAAIMIGILATVLLQSSSTTTSIIVSMAGTAVSVNTGIYMIMGTNIGTTITNIVVSLGQVNDTDQLERAFAGASVHHLFNFLTVAVLLPLEVTTHYLSVVTFALTKRHAHVSAGGSAEQQWVGPIQKIVSPLADLIIISNEIFIEVVAEGGAGSCALGDGYYPISCENNAHPTYDTCGQGLIGCNQVTNACPAFFQPGANATDDKVSGGVVFFIGTA